MTQASQAGQRRPADRTNATLQDAPTIFTKVTKIQSRGPDEGLEQEQQNRRMAQRPSADKG